MTISRRFTSPPTLFFFFLMIRPPPRSPPFPYTPLFRSNAVLPARPTVQGFSARSSATRASMLATGTAPSRRKRTTPLVRFRREGAVPVASIEARVRSEEHTSELQSPDHLLCRLLPAKKN